MNTPNKTLLQILTEELPKRGGWPDGYLFCVQDGDETNDLKFGIRTHDLILDGRNVWVVDDDESSWGACAGLSAAKRFALSCTAADYATAIITREQYEAALLAATTQGTITLPVDGWIDWAGGECPVEPERLVDVKLRDGSIFCGMDADGWRWSDIGHNADIIAYRLHQPQEAVQAKADYEADLNDCIGQQQEDLDALRTKMVGDIYLATGSITLNDAFNIAHGLIDAGYRKQ